MSKCSVQKLAVRKMSNAYFYIPHMNRMMRDVTNVVGMYAVLLLHTLGIDTLPIQKRYKPT